jgi:hypothetical protein
VLQSTSLYFREGSSGKEYHAAIEPKGDGFIVNFAYSRCGSTLNTGTKTQFPISLMEATKVFDKLIASPPLAARMRICWNVGKIPTVPHPCLAVPL